MSERFPMPVVPGASSSETSSAPLIPRAPRPREKRLLRPFLVLLAGLILLCIVAVAEATWWALQPWGATIVNVDSAHPPAGAYSARVRSLPLEQLPQVQQEVALFDQMSDEETDLVTLLGVRRTESIVAVSGYSNWDSLLTSGRAPTPGANEVLAGTLARLDRFTLDGETFEVVGRLSPGVGGFRFAYALPYEAGAHGGVFSAASGATRGWVFPAGVTEMASVLEVLGGGADIHDDDAAFDRASKTLQEAMLSGGNGVLAGALNPPMVKWGVWFALVIMAAGGSWFHVRLFRRLAPHAVWPAGTLLRAMEETPRLWVFLHVLLYGVFAGAMAFGLLEPLQNMRVMGMIAGMFQDGDLQYIGDAYASGNVFRAAAATFVNNYWQQTVLLTLLISLVPVAAGVLKTGGSFGLVGFAMAPNMAGSGSGYTYHSITMVLELEAYIVASFCAVFWVRQCARAFSNGFGRELGKGFSVMLGGALVTAVMLAIAAFYEGATLIAFGGH